MKAAPLLLLSVLLFSISTHPSFCSAARALDPVIDTTGNSLRVGSLYEILPANPTSGAAGGIILQVTRNKTCPFDVIQEQTDYQGLPMAFSPYHVKEGDVVRVSTDLKVDFPSTFTSCRKVSNVWTLDKYDPFTGQYFVTTGAVKGKPSPKTAANWFKIEKFGYGTYKLKYCPSFCSYCMCKDIGIFVEDEKRRLALSDVPFEIVFKKD